MSSSTRDLLLVAVGSLAAGSAAVAAGIWLGRAVV